MFVTLIDKIWPVTRPLRVGDRVTDSKRVGTIKSISENIYSVVQWDNDSQVVHYSKELKITRKKEKL